MTFLFVKLYEEYKRTDTPNPEDRVVLYATYFTLMAFFPVFILLFEVLNAIFFDKQLGVHPLFLIGTALIISVKGYKIIYRKFFRQNKMARLQEKYGLYSINRMVLYLTVFILPIFTFLSGISISIFLTGGEILGTRFRGLIG